MGIPMNAQSLLGSVMRCYRVRIEFICNHLSFQPLFMFHSPLLLVRVMKIRSNVVVRSLHCIYQKTFYCNDHTITEFGITDKNSSTAYIILYKLIDTWFLDSNSRMGVWSLPWHWHILSIPLPTGRGTTCGLDDVFPPDDLGSRPEALC